MISVYLLWANAREESRVEGVYVSKERALKEQRRRERQEARDGHTVHGVTDGADYDWDISFHIERKRLQK